MTGDRNDRDDRQDSHDGAPTLVPGEPRSFGGGRYIVRKRLGAGNFATVYLAYDERLDVPVAVKLLSDRWSWEPEVRGRFVQEARLLRSLNDARPTTVAHIW
ncbi:MAG: protein kinase [Acidimicrobiaceae bacterium]|nr:MAG: protein kinase [Acidimicrobiaceae bacterium]